MALSFYTHCVLISSFEAWAGNLPESHVNRGKLLQLPTHREHSYLLLTLPPFVLGRSFRWAMKTQGNRQKSCKSVPTPFNHTREVCKYIYYWSGASANIQEAATVGYSFKDLAGD